MLAGFSVASLAAVALPARSIREGTRMVVHPACLETRGAQSNQGVGTPRHVVLSKSWQIVVSVARSSLNPTRPRPSLASSPPPAARLTTARLATIRLAGRSSLRHAIAGR